MAKLYLDVESAGIKGPLHLIQYALDRGPVQIIRVSQARQEETLSLLRLLEPPTTVVVGYNVGFDLWKLYQHYQPPAAWHCRVIDLYQHVLKSPPLCYFPLVGGKAVVRLVRVPNKYLAAVEKILLDEIRSILPPIAEPRVTRSRGPGEFTTVEVTVRIYAKLKLLAQLFLPPEEREEIINFDEVLCHPGNFVWERPENLETVRGFKEDERFPFPATEEEARLSQALWEHNEGVLDSAAGEKAIEYGRKDVEYLFKLEDWLESNGAVVEEDSDDVCTHVVAYTKYHGIPVDVRAAQILSEKYSERMARLQADLGIDPESPVQRLDLLKLHSYAPELIKSTSAEHLQILAEEGDAGILTPEGVAMVGLLRAYKPLAQRRKQLEVITQGDGRVYPDFVVLGTNTCRMRGRGGLNFQGISREGEIRSLFKTSQGGDFDGLEWCIAASVYQDAEMLRGLADGDDPHTRAVALLAPEKGTYSDLIAIKMDKKHPRHEEIKELRGKMKRINFGVLYQAGPHKIASELGCTPEEAEEKMEACYFSHYKSLAATREKLVADFCTADFETWKKDSVARMGDRVVGVFGDTRWICFERHMAIFLWENADKFAEVAKGDETRVLRREAKGEQLIGQAIRSAVLGAASAIQKTVMRQLGNFSIQNAGARLTKCLMASIWERHHIPIINVHDELDVPAGYEKEYEAVQETVEDFLQENREKIAHLSLSWERTTTWADK